MDLRQLKTFLVLCNSQNFTKAGEILGYSQSNISAQIKQLENELGGPLFNRLGHTITLSAKGLELLPYAQKILSLSNEAVEQISTKKEIISIIISESLCTYILPAALRAYRITHPDTEFRIELYDEEFYNHLQTGKADFAFILNNEIKHSYIHNIFEFPLKIGIYAAPENHLLTTDSISMKDFEHMPLLLTGTGCLYREAFLKLFENSGIKPHIVLETSSLQVIKEMTICGIGLCVLPEIAVSKEIETKTLAPIPFAFDITLNASLLTHKDKILTTSQKEFAEALLAQIR